MQKACLLIYLFTAFASSAFAQKVSLKGSVNDTSNNIDLSEATIVLLQAKDSILASFTRTNNSGNFTINNVDTGKYILLVSYPNYADYTEEFSLDHNEVVKDFGNLELITKTALLTDVIVRANTAIRIKGDTTEFTADSFKVNTNANVEDLLKRLPGFQIDRSGKITAQGQTIKKVLVDGEEFFGDDPTLVTKNIKATMVDKVQLYDRTSDQAALTGIDDGARNKTVNIKLKEEQKKGYFGKIDVAGGAENFNKGKGYYYGQGMFNSFKTKRKFSAYGTFANTGDIGLNFNDATKYGVSNADGMETVEGGNISATTTSGSDELDWSGQSNNGYPDVQSGGIHYDNKWNDKHFVNGNYKIGRIARHGSSATTQQNNLPDRIIFSENKNNFSNNLFRQKADGVYEFNINPTSMLKITASGSVAHTSSNNSYETASRLPDSTKLNDNQRNLSDEGTRNSFSSTVYYQKKLKKKGRTISGLISSGFFDEKTSGNLFSKSNFYDSAGNTEVIDQFKNNNSTNNNLSSKVTYTEPLGKRLTLVSNYGYNIQRANSKRLSHNKDAAGHYSILDSIYSNRYAFDQYNHRGGLALNYSKNKLTFNFGTDLSAVNYKQTDLFKNKGSIERNFVNWFPFAKLYYRLSQQKNFEINYNGNTNQPNINQLQPLFVNDDPLNIYIGNPELKPSFSNSINAQYADYKVLTERYFGFWGSYNITLNPIVTNLSTNEKGENRYNYSNLKDGNNPNYNLNMWYGKKFQKLWDIRYSTSLNTNGNKSVSYINGVLNKTTSSSFGIGQALEKNKNDVYEFALHFNINYSINKSSLQQQVANNGFNYNIRGNALYFITKKIVITSDIDYFWQQKTASFNKNFERLIWNAYLTKKFGKKDNIEIKVSLRDILNQNNGFSRWALNNTIAQTRNTTIGRFMMLSFIYEFNKIGGK